jgi:hypothetical protein
VDDVSSRLPPGAIRCLQFWLTAYYFPREIEANGAGDEYQRQCATRGAIFQVHAAAMPCESQLGRNGNLIGEVGDRGGAQEGDEERNRKDSVVLG